MSTSEVEALVSNAIDKKDAVAYGVEVQGLEGEHVDETATES